MAGSQHSSSFSSRPRGRKPAAVPVTATPPPRRPRRAQPQRDRDHYDNDDHPNYDHRDPACRLRQTGGSRQRTEYPGEPDPDLRLRPAVLIFRHQSGDAAAIERRRPRDRSHS